MIKTKYLCSGGGDDIEKIIKKFSSVYSFEGKSVSYVIIASESNKEFLKFIEDNFSFLNSVFESLGVTDLRLVKEDNVKEVKATDIVIVSGGDTNYLLEVLDKVNFISLIKGNKKLSVLAGISAGTIALFDKGVGTKEGKEYMYNGLGLIPGTVIVHSNEDLKNKYSDAIHLDEYNQFEK